MKYFEIQPSGAAARFIKSYWALEDDSPSLEAQRIIPDGRPVLIFNLDQPFESLTASAWKRQPQSFIVGQITQPLLLRANGPAKMLGINFHPHGASHVLGMPFNELTDSAIALDDISIKLHRRLKRLGESSQMDGLAAMDAAMNEIILGDRHEVDFLVSAAVSMFEHSSGLVNVANVARMLGVSSRHLQRRFLETVGISPKLFSRMQRFQRVFQAMERLNWVNTAIDCGYYDQAHLIKDFQEFAGKAPTALMNEEIVLMRRFIKG
jgi:AraC-like DNA-binding protein